MGISSLVRGTAAAMAFAGTMLAATPSQAGVMQVTLWQQIGGSNGINDPEEQALPTNPLAGGSPVANFIYTGVLNWFQAGGSGNTLNAFVGYSGGAVSNCVGSACVNSTTLSSAILSTANFGTTSLFRIIFTTDGAVSGPITHDDGFSIYGPNGVVFSHSNPVSPHLDANVLIPAAGTYTLWYVEANSSPSVLNVDPRITERSRVPEPATLAMLAIALLSLFGIGAARKNAAI